MTSTNESEFIIQRPRIPPGECSTFGVSGCGRGADCLLFLRSVIKKMTFPVFSENNCGIIEKAASAPFRGAPQCADANPQGSPALPDFFPAARAAAARPSLPCRGEGGIVFGFFGTENVSRGDSVPPGITQPSHTSSCSPLRGRASSILMPSFADRPPYSTPYIASVIGMETPCCCARW